MEENLKTIKLKLDYFDEDGNHSLKDLNVKVNKIKDLSFSVGFGRVDRKYGLTFSLTIPAHIHAFLLEKTVPVHEMSDRNGVREYRSDFPKTLNSNSIEKLCDLYLGVVRDYRWLKSIDSLELEKVIFYDFKNESSDLRSDWNGLNLGKKSKLNYSYFIGYVTTKSKNEIRYNENKAIINDSYDREAYRYSFVKWTQERQDFFDSLNASFGKIIEQVNTFSETINEGSVDSIMNGSSLLELTN